MTKLSQLSLRLITPQIYNNIIKTFNWFKQLLRFARFMRGEGGGAGGGLGGLGGTFQVKNGPGKVRAPR
jgi:hypothetical protein